MKKSQKLSGIITLAFLLLAYFPQNLSAHVHYMEGHPQTVDYDKVGVDHGGTKTPPPPPTLGMDEEEKDVISFYPNPCGDRLKLELGDRKRLKITVFDLPGNLVLQQELSQSSPVINTSSLKPGIYLLHTAVGTYRFAKY